MTSMFVCLFALTFLRTIPHPAPQHLTISYISIHVDIRVPVGVRMLLNKPTASVGTLTQ